jgi:hypothetical protein
MDAAVAPPRAGAPWFAAAMVLSSLLLAVLVSHLPVGILSDAGHDDAWFWLRAESIAAGDWLGRYDQLTLIKGSGYPLFLALVHALGLPLGTAQALLYAAACVLFGTALHRMGARRGFALAVVLALQWHPSALAWTRVLRDSIGAAQAVLLLACVLHFLFATGPRRRGWTWAALAGLVLGWTWTTREDAVWILPGIALLVLARAVAHWRERAGRRRLLTGVLIMAVVFAGWTSLVATANLLKYGVFATVETRESGFPDAVAALQRVRVGEAVPYVPVPRDVREAVYGVSPAFARLRPWFEGGGRRWTEPGCGHYPHACGDYAGGWFIWALRDGVASIGGYRSAPAADAFYRQVAAEVQAACADGRLHCARTLAGSIPPVAPAQWRTVPGRTRVALSMLLWQGIGAGETPSHLRSARVLGMWRFVGQPRVPDALGSGQLHVDALHPGIPADAAAPRWARSLKSVIGRLYRTVLPWLALAGLLGFAWATLRAVRSRAAEPLYLLAASAWVLAASRVALLVLVDMSSFPALKVHYLQPAFPLLVLASMVSLALAARAGTSPAAPAVQPTSTAPSHGP